MTSQKVRCLSAQTASTTISNINSTDAANVLLGGEFDLLIKKKEIIT
jgi:hypothetical protein